jgi:hypothetical protein
MDFELSPKAKDYVKRTRAFIQEHIEPASNFRPR